MTEVVLIQGSLLTVVSKQKNRNNTRNTIASSYNSKVWSTQSIGVQFSPCLGHGKWYYIITCLGNGKVFADNSKLINLFILYFKNVLAVPHYFIKMFYIQQSYGNLHSSWCNNSLCSYHELRQDGFFSIDQKKVPFLSSHLLHA